MTGAMKPGPEGIEVGDVFQDRDSQRWLFTGFNDVAGEPFALARDGWPVLASELIRHAEYRHRKPAHPVTPVLIERRDFVDHAIGTADSWPRDPDGWCDSWHIIKLHRGLRVAWLVHTALYRPSTGEQKPDRQAWCDRQHIVLHSAHFGTLQRLTLWYEHDHTDVYGYRDKEGRWT
ncbi:hypothetical protein [Streptomyces chartreusis]|uniref:hypothetical protein n=1 Tax=Streptomyces chartreusis TaxID=1969 RepID=UPI003687EDC5